MKLLITGAWNCTAKQLEHIKNMGHSVKLIQYEKDEIKNPSSFDGVICNSLFLYHDIREFTNLKYIQLTSSGFDRIPMDYIKENNISIFNARGVYSIPMAEFAISGVLGLYKQNRFFSKNQSKHKWIKHRELIELFGKTVCIVGCGSVGTECAKRFSAFGCKVIGTDLFPCENSSCEQIYPIDELKSLLPQSDIVIITLPLAKDTKHLFNKDMLNNCKQGAVLVNIARGAIIDTNALIEALANNLGGAVLDVFEEEPLAEDSPLWDMDNVILTPHNSFVGDGNNERLFNLIYENLKNYTN